ncbi:MAG TPA: FkbM family methyltransferase [Vicinamibacterales bacterium]|nr:FkbM family methyltransferase [Vicinamibacterales bacterium]
MRATLPDGLEIEAFSDLEAKILYREIVAEQTYERHGVTLAPGAVIFDVGANIGLFAIHMARSVPGARIRSFEPAPQTFAMLQRNLSAHAPEVTAVEAGLSARDERVTIMFDRFSSITTSMHPAAMSGASKPGATLMQWITAGLRDLDRTDSSGVSRGLLRALNRGWSRWPAAAVVLLAAAGLEVRKRIFRSSVSIQLRTLSGELAASGLDRIDLAKIDVEGAEEQVLDGIADRDWPRIRQFVIEVHDVDGRLERMASRLRAHGYRVAIDREDWALHELMGISTIYAVRE